MNILTKYTTLFLLFIICLGANGQQLENFRITRTKQLISTESSTVNTQEPFNAISFRVKDGDFGNMEIILPTRTVKITKDDHLTLEKGIQSNLIILAKESNTFTLVGNYRGEIECILQYVKPIVHNSIAVRRAACELPGMVMQSTWRQGLPDPVPGRTKTPTEHCIIHHSADGNGNSDYTALVRAYYTHHTQTNGWDDIGYNYLIANDGTLYAGRDPELPSIDQDNVLGAHFCGKNQNTMGVCIIGNYQGVEPSFAAINTLTTLLTWKLDKERLVVTDSFPHPTASDPLLSVIDGHRSACSTACPGENLWAQIPAIRQMVHNKLDQCSTVGMEELDLNTLTIYPNPNNGSFHIDFTTPVSGQLQIMSLNGKEILSTEIVNESKIEILNTNISAGFYLVKLLTAERQFIQKIQITK